MEDMGKTGLKVSVLAWTLVMICSCTPKDPAEVLKRVDAKIYYPDKAGMTSLSCQVQTPYLAEMFDRLNTAVPGSEKILDQLKVEIVYYWGIGNGGKYSIKGVPGELSALQNSIREVVNGTDILVMPPSEQKQFEPFKLSLRKDDKKLVVVGVNPDQNSEFREYHLTVNPRDWMILQRKFVGRNFVSNSTLSFEVWKGKRSPVKIETLQEITKKDPGQEEPDFKSLVEISYQELEGYRLVKRLTYSFSRPDTGEKVVGPVELDFENCRINAKLPPDFSKQPAVIFMETEDRSRLIPEPQKPVKKSPEPKAKASPAGKAKKRRR